MTKLLDWERATRIMEERNIDILVGTGFINYGYITGYFTHFGADYPGPLYNGAPLIRLAGLPRDASLSPFLITYPGEEGDMIAYGSWIEDRWYWGPKYHVPGRTEALKVGGGSRGLPVEGAGREGPCGRPGRARFQRCHRGTDGRDQEGLAQSRSDRCS